jgi:hypothetical protein
MKINRNIVLLLVLFAVLPLVSATTLEVNSYYDPGSLVEISGSCARSGADVGIQITNSYETVFVDQVESTPQFSALYKLPTSASGTYNVYAGCSDEDTVTKTFTVGSEPDTPTPSTTERKDSDSDDIKDFRDNCPNTYNPDQNDSDDDGIGDVCDETPWVVTVITPEPEVKKYTPPPAPKPTIKNKIDANVGPVCGDGVCALTENVEECPQDCKTEDEARFSFIWIILLVAIGGAVVWGETTGRLNDVIHNVFDKTDKLRNINMHSTAVRETNITLINYIKAQRGKGFDIPKIKNALVNAGWASEDVDAALRSNNN